eukprot:Gb_09928 [translate_table: standard]
MGFLFHIQIIKIVVVAIILFCLPSSVHSSDFSNLFRETLSEDVSQSLAHCDSLNDSQRLLLCELIGALDAQGSDIDISSSQIENNDIRSPNGCRFKYEGGHELHRYRSPRSAPLQTVLDRYVAMHRRCTALEFDNITNIYNSGEKPQCKYLIWSIGYFGLGNRLLSLVSAFAYAILSQRVLLIEYPVWDHLFCDPFDGSPWKIVPERPLNKSLGVSYLGFRGMGCGFGNTDPRCGATIVNMALHHETPAEELEFVVCESGFSRVRNVPFLTTMFSNQFYIVGFFLNPALGLVMELLFPERNPFHVLAKYLLSPSDHVWDAIRYYNDGTLSKATRRIGVQIREFGNNYTEAIDSNVVACIRRKSALCPIGDGHVAKSKEDGFVSLYVATLMQGHVAKLNKSVQNEMGRSFKVMWQELDGRENYDPSHQQEALIDMWVLSLSDVLLTSKMSTFGYVAQGLGGITPYLINSSEEEEPCKANVGSDPCYHFAPKDTICKDDFNRSSHELFQQSNSVQECPDFPDRGWQLVTPF